MKKSNRSRRVIRDDYIKYCAAVTPDELARGCYLGPAAADPEGGGTVDVLPRAYVEFCIDHHNSRLTPAEAREMARRLVASADVIEGHL